MKTPEEIRLQQLRDENQRLRDALRPFAEAADKFDPVYGDAYPLGVGITVMELRSAKKALMRP